MEKSEFSETQFEAYHSRQFERFITGIHPQFFPTRVEEGYFGVDMVHFGEFHNYFFQYKIPKFLNGKSKKSLQFSGNSYRIDIYNKVGKRSESQYKLLWEWAITEPHVYYVTPLFYTRAQFASNFHNVINYSAHFNVKDLKNPFDSGFDDENHFIYYDDVEEYGYMHSENKIKVDKSDLTEISKNNNLGEFESYVNQMFKRINKILINYEMTESQIIDASLQFTDVYNENIINKDLHSNVHHIRTILRNIFNLDWVILVKPSK